MAGEQRFSSTDDLAHLVAGALDGHEAAWTALVERLERVVWKSVNMMTTDREIREDAFAATWLRLAERLDTIREPHKLPGWLATTACNEVRQIGRQRSRQPLAGSEAMRDDATHALGGLDASWSDEGDLDRGLLADERARDVRTAFGRLDDGCRELITVLVLADPPLPYDEASELLGRPIGSLGPTRKRCLEKMRLLIDHEGGE
jgi:RNA polymerase sigma factor (sigma-70 family)